MKIQIVRSHPQIFSFRWSSPIYCSKECPGDADETASLALKVHDSNSGSWESLRKGALILSRT